MYVFCCKCERILGCKAPFDREREEFSSTYCDECLMADFNIPPEKLYKFKKGEEKKGQPER